MKDLYIVSKIGTNKYKIGISNNLIKRLNVLQSSNPDRVEFIYILKEGEKLEQRFHELFEEHKDIIFMVD